MRKQETLRDEGSTGGGSRLPSWTPRVAGGSPESLSLGSLPESPAGLPAAPSLQDGPPGQPFRPRLDVRGAGDSQTAGCWGQSLRSPLTSCYQRDAGKAACTKPPAAPARSPGNPSQALGASPCVSQKSCGATCHHRGPSRSRLPPPLGTQPPRLSLRRPPPPCHPTSQRRTARAQKMSH